MHALIHTCIRTQLLTCIRTHARACMSKQWVLGGAWYSQSPNLLDDQHQPCWHSCSEPLFQKFTEANCWEAFMPLDQLFAEINLWIYKGKHGFQQILAFLALRARRLVWIKTVFDLTCQIRSFDYTQRCSVSLYMRAPGWLTCQIGSYE